MFLSESIIPTLPLYVLLNLLSEDNFSDFCIKNFSNANDLSGYRLAVDTPEDLDRMKKIIGSMTRPQTEYSLDELIELYPSA